MAFIIEKTNDNYSVSRVHAVLRLETQNGHLVAVVNSYATEQAFNEQKLNWQDSHQIPVTTAGDPQTWLISTEGPFNGATLLDETTPLAVVQSLKWAEIKAERDRRTTGGFVYLDKIFDSDIVSVAKINGAAIEALSNPEYTETWTLADNSLLAMSAEQIIGMASALRSHASSLQHTGTELRNQIFAELGEDETEEQAITRIKSIYWPI